MYEKLTIEEARELKEQLKKAGEDITDALITAHQIINKMVQVPEFVRTMQRHLVPKFVVIRHEILEILTELKEEMAS